MKRIIFLMDKAKLTSLPINTIERLITRTKAQIGSIEAQQSTRIYIGNITNQIAS